MRVLLPEELLPGDLIACWGTDRQARTISWGTASLLAPPGMRLSPSHVALITDHPQYGPVWVESTTLCRHPCLFRGKPVSGCQAHLPVTRVTDYVEQGGRVEVYRPTEINSLDSGELVLLRRILLTHFVARGVRYDMSGALLSARRITTLPRLISADLETVFCSELAAAVIQRLGRLSRCRNPSWYHPGRLIRDVYSQGTYSRYADCVPYSADRPCVPFRKAA